VLLEDKAEREAMDIEDSAVKFLEDPVRGRGVLEGDEMCVAGKVVHNNHDRCIAIGFVERAGEVYGWGLVGFVGLREGKGSSTG